MVDIGIETSEDVRRRGSVFGKRFETHERASLNGIAGTLVKGNQVDKLGDDLRIVDEQR